MYEKVNPSHVDKVADRIAGAIVDMAYAVEENPKVAVEVLLGHGKCNVIIESTVMIKKQDIESAIKRIAGESIVADITLVPQDEHLTKNQKDKIRCGDNGVFKGMPLTEEQKKLSEIARKIYKEYPFDGKYVIDGDKIIICQSNVNTEEFKKKHIYAKNQIVNPLGDWTGGSDVDSGATNRKLGSDMGDGVTGSGIQGKDLSKADVSVNIYAFLKAQQTGEPVNLCCAIGDEKVDGLYYDEIVEIARKFIDSKGGFEKFAEWGLF